MSLVLLAGIRASDGRTICPTVHDPGVSGEQTFIMRIPEFLAAPFQAGVARTQSRWVGRVGDRLLAAAVSSHDQLHRSCGGDQTDNGEFGEAVGVLHLRILDPPEQLLDDPSHTVPADSLAALLQRGDLRGGQRPPLHGFNSCRRLPRHRRPRVEPSRVGPCPENPLAA